MFRCSKPLCLKTCLKTSCLSVTAIAAMIAFTADWSISQEKKPPLKQAPSKRPPTAEEAILKALDQPTEVLFDQTPLSEVMRFFQDKHKINIVANTRALEDSGIVAKDTLITRSLTGIKLRSALNLILEELGLAFCLRDEALVVTSKEDADAFLVTKIYPVEDFPRRKGRDDDDESDYGSLIMTIEAIVHPDSWQDVGGPGAIFAFGGALVIQQTHVIHREIATLLDVLRKARRQQEEAKGDARLAVIKVYDHQAEDKILKASQRRLSFSFAKKPLSDVCKKFAQQYNVPIEFNRRALEDAGIVPEDTGITLKLSGVSLSSALNLMLPDLDLAWVIKRELLLITSKEDADAFLQTRFYPIRDILLKTDDAEDGDFGSLIELITNCVHPNSWDNVGGPGSISEAGILDSLICSQTQQAHEEIEKLLANLRKVLPARKATQKENVDKVSIQVYYVSDSLAARPKGALISNPKAAEQAADIIPNLVALGTWNGKDGPGYIRAYSDRIVVRHTRKVHREVRKLLIKLGLLEDLNIRSGGFF